MIDDFTQFNFAKSNNIFTENVDYETIIIFLSLLIFSILIFAHGSSRQKVVEEIEINASPDKVWSVISDFCSTKDWNPSIKNCQADQGSKISSVRMINMLYAMEKLEAG